MLLSVPNCSIEGNDIGAQGAASFAKALETNSSLRELKYAAKQTLPHNLHPNRQKPITVICPLPRSMYQCFIGAEGAKYLSEGLAKNEGLTSLKCAASHPTPAVTSP